MLKCDCDLTCACGEIKFSGPTIIGKIVDNLMHFPKQCVTVEILGINQEEKDDERGFVKPKP